MSITVPKNAGEMINAAEVYKIIGVDLTKCTVQHTDFQAASVDNSSVGGLIANELQPALESLADGLLLRQAAPAYDARIEERQQRVAKAITHFMSPSLTDSAAVAEFSKKMTEKKLEAVVTEINDIVEDITTALTDKVRLVVATKGLHKV